MATLAECLTCGRTWGSEEPARTRVEARQHADEHGHRVRFGLTQVAVYDAASDRTPTSGDRRAGRRITFDYYLREFDV